MATLVTMKISVVKPSLSPDIEDDGLTWLLFRVSPSWPQYKVEGMQRISPY